MFGIKIQNWYYKVYYPEENFQDIEKTIPAEIY